MLSNLIILHKKVPNAKTSLHVEAHYYWSTCLRTLAFYDKSRLQPSDILFLEKERSNGWDMHQSQDTYQILLQIILGLDSQILGETEVHSQFKECFNDERLQHSHMKNILQPLRNSLLSQAKFIRAQYFQNLGSHSYAGIARKLSKNCSDIYLLGTGHLAKQMIPFLQKKHLVHIVGRNYNHIETELHIPKSPNHNVSKACKIKQATKNSHLNKEIPQQQSQFYTFTEFKELQLAQSSVIIIAACLPTFFPYLSNIQANARIIDYRADHEDNVHIFDKYNYYSLQQIYKTRENVEAQKRDLFLKIQTLIKNKFRYHPCHDPNFSSPNIFDENVDPIDYQERLNREACLSA